MYGVELISRPQSYKLHVYIGSLLNHISDVPFVKFSDYFVVMYIVIITCVIACVSYEMLFV